MDNLHRDELTMPLIAQHFAPYHEYMAALRDLLMRGRSVRGRRRDEARAAIGHALAFTTWRSLTREQGLDRRPGGRADVRARGRLSRAGERVPGRR